MPSTSSRQKSAQDLRSEPLSGVVWRACMEEEKGEAGVAQPLLLFL